MPTELTVEVLAAPVVNHAMAHNGLPFLHRLVVSSAVPLADVLLTARVVDVFGAVLSRPWQHPVERVEAGQPLVVDQPALRLDPGYLSAVEEETGAEIVVEVTVAGEPVGSTAHPIRVQAARQWTLDPAAPVLSLELLAAFVQPNHPALPPLVSEAAQILETVTGSGSLAVSHATGERIDEIVGAVFTAVHDREIFYAQPPASWGYGQKVRTPGDVLTDRVGTCLDTTLLLASALEHVGITPVLWIAYGHAFLGYWREPERGLPDAASTQIAVPANAVDLELMGVLETTLVTRERRPPRDLVRRARQAPRDAYFLGGAADLLGVVDVGMARMLRVYPLPARRERADGVVEVIEYVPPTQPTTAASAAAAGSSPTDLPQRTPAEPAPPRVQAWKNALLDLTLRNKLLNLRQPMTQVPLLLPPEHLGMLANQLQDGRTVSVRAVDDLTGAVVSEGARDAYALPADVQRAMLANKATIYSGHARDDHDRAFARLRYRARTGREETGANPLMLALGRLDWQLGERTLAAPLLLLPVDIKGVVMPYRLAADPTGAVTVNLSLLEKLRVEFGFAAPDLDELPPRADGEGVDVEAVVRRFREAIAESGLAFRVESEARLIIGGFTGFLLWRDLDEHWERFVQRPLVRQLLDGKLDEVPAAFAEGADDPAFDDPAAVAALDAVVATAPIPADGAQARAIAAARAGHSFVLEGPPGTGKSQTITNILADQLAQGRRVLFVAEKGAALDVVRHRLGEIGLLPYALDLHDHNARPVEVRARIRTALAQRGRPDLDGYRAALGEVEGSASALRGYAQRLHRANRAGLSLWSARATALARGAGPTLTVPPAVLSGDGAADETAAGIDLARLRRLVAGAAEDLGALDPEVARAWGFVGVAETPVDPAAVLPLLPAADAAVTAATVALDQVTRRAAELLRRAVTRSQLHDLVALFAAPVSGHELAEIGSARWAAARAELTARTETWRRAAAPVLVDFTPDVLGVDLGPVRQDLRIAEHSFFLGRKGRLLTAAGPVLVHLRPGRELPPKELPARVETLATLAEQHRTVLAGWQALPGLGWLSAEANLLSDAGTAQLAAATARVDDLVAALGRLGPEVAAEVVAVRRDEPELATETTRALSEALDRLGAVFTATHSRPLDQAAYGAAGLLEAWRDGIPARTADSPHGGALRRWVRAATALEPLAADLPDARWQLLSGQVVGADAVAALERGMAEGSLIERWDAGGFRAFDAAGQDRSVGRFLGAADAVRAASVSVLPASLIDARPFGTGAVFGRVAALEREVGRSRGGLSVRSLISTYGEVIAAITPCVLVSPDSLARFIAPGAMDFDLVVFDEASQITVPDAIGALGRAAACVVAGDSQQMPPYSFGQLGTDEGEDTDERRLPGRAGRGEHPVRVRAGGAAAALAVLALPQPGREPDQLLQRAVLRGPAVVVPRVPRAAPRHRRQLHPGGRDLPAQRDPGDREGTAADQPGRGGRRGRGGAAALAAAGALDRRGDVQHPAAGSDRVDAVGQRGDRTPGGARAQGRRAVREEPGERPGRRARRDHLLHRLLGGRQRRAAVELRAAEPVRWRAAAQRRRHPGPAAGDGVQLLRSGGHPGRPDLLGRHQAPPRLPRAGQVRCADPGAHRGRDRPARRADRGRAACGGLHGADRGRAVGVPDRPGRGGARSGGGGDAGRAAGRPGLGGAHHDGGPGRRPGQRLVDDHGLARRGQGLAAGLVVRPRGGGARAGGPGRRLGGDAQVGGGGVGVDHVADVRAARGGNGRTVGSRVGARGAGPGRRRPRDGRGRRPSRRAGRQRSRAGGAARRPRAVRRERAGPLSLLGAGADGPRPAGPSRGGRGDVRDRRGVRPDQRGAAGPTAGQGVRAHPARRPPRWPSCGRCCPTTSAAIGRTASAGPGRETRWTGPVSGSPPTSRRVRCPTSRCWRSPTRWRTWPARRWASAPTSCTGRRTGCSGGTG